MWHQASTATGLVARRAMACSVLLGVLCAALVATRVRGLDGLESRQALGWGAQRLQGRGTIGETQTSTLLRTVGATNCDDVEGPLFFKDAVVDNFAPVSEQTNWSQRYWLNKRNWAGKGAPIIVFIGGEGEEGCGRLSSRMSMYNLAIEHHALLVDVEHRFYGQSMPTADASTKSLRYLSSQQALADLVRIVTQIKKDLGTESSKVLTVGGSYPGALSAWAREKYPSTFDGAISSSAPVLAKTEFSEYMDVVASSMEYFGGQQCVDSFANAAAKIAQLFVDGPQSAGMKQLEADFKVCKPITSKLDLSVMLSDLMGNVQGTVQYNNEHIGVLNVTDICSTMLKTGSDSYTNFVELTRQYREANKQNCEDASFADTISFLGNASLALPANAARSWTYQTCAEFGYFQTASSPLQPFYSWRDVLDLSFSMEICRAAFDGWSKDPDVNWTNTDYGGLEIDATNIVFVAGNIDPWHALAVTNFTQPLPQQTETVVFITGTAHCADLYAEASSDPPSLTFARQVVADKVRQILA